MTELSRRNVLQIAGGTAAAAFTWTDAEVRAAADSALAARSQAAATGQPYLPQFFTTAEYATVIALADLIIPRDARSASASEAGAPEFIDCIVAAQPNRQMALRGGLAWLDAECQRRSEKPFLDCVDMERRRVLDDIAWPARARPELSHGVAFFNTMRDLVAAGFWSSRIGVADIGYMGNRISAWDGPPPAVLQKIGIAE
jgi:gluconate 2-dehydrogenase gamma chain